MNSKYKMHMNEGSIHRKKALDALRAFAEFPWERKYWIEYKEESKLANKHYGICTAMITRKYGKSEMV